MSLTLSAKTYDNDVARGTDSYRYLGPSHTSSFRDMVDLYRTAAPSVDNGTAKSKARAKLSRSATDGTDQLATDIIFDCNMSIPEGAATAEIDAVIDELVAFMGTSAFKDLVKGHIVNQ